MKDIYDILVRVCGADEDKRLAFNSYLAEPDDFVEWRFQGKLGFGGKFYKIREKMYVDCYLEDKTPEREKIITEANKLLVNRE